MGIIWMILVGFAAGSLAKYIMPGKEPGGFVITTMLGIIGGVVGGFLLRAIGIGLTGVLGDVIGATVGAIVLIWLYNRFVKKKASD